MEKKTLKRFFYIIFGCLTLSSAVMLFVPYVSFTESNLQKVVGICLGVIFWMGLMAGWVLYALVYYQLKRRGRLSRKKKAGIWCFFNNREAALADIICVITLVMNIIILFIHIPWPWVESTVAFLFLVSFHGHYIFNGITYQEVFSM